MASKSYSIHIIERDEAVRRALALLTVAEGFEAFTYRTAAEYLERRRRDGSGCILLDLRLPGMDLLKRLGLGSHRLPVIVMSVDGDAGLAMRALAAGAAAFLEKPFAAETLFSAIAAARGAPAPPSVPEAVAEAARQIAALSRREREVLAALAAGRKQKEIARSLGISERTVEGHQARMLRRLGLARVAAALRLYALADLAPAPDRTLAPMTANPGRGPA